MQSKSRGGFSLYWWAYGGWAALWRSGYLRVAIIFTLFSFNTWVHEGWWNISMDSLPTMLGFTVAGFAVFIGFGDDGFRSKMAEVDKGSTKPSEYIQFCASFVHFILVQALALMFALLANSYNYHSDYLNCIRYMLPYLNGFFGFIGYGLFIYSITTIVAVAMHFLNLAEIYSEYKKFQAEFDD